MKVRDEINKFSEGQEKEDLLTVFTKYHWSSTWTILATCEFLKKTPTSYPYGRKWSLTYIGQAVLEKIKREQ